MAGIWTGLGKLMPWSGRGPTGPARVSPYSEQGVSGTPIYGGIPRSVDINALVRGQQRYRSASEIATNISIVAAGLRYFLNLVAKPTWNLDPADTPNGEEGAEFMDSVIHDMATAWPRQCRRQAMYRYHGFGIAEWTAKKRDDGRIGLLDIEQRPQHTIERWGADDKGTITGVWQRNPQDGQLIWLPKSKIVYLVDDAMTDNPEGSGWFRALVDPWQRMKRYLELETIGFERNLSGTPVGRIPYTEIEAMVKRADITRQQADAMISAMEQFVDLQVKEPTTNIVLDSATYQQMGPDGPQWSNVAKWGIELLKGDMTGIEHLGAAIDRLAHDMARVIGCESLLIGDDGAGSLAMSRDKTQNLYLVINSTLGDMAEAYDRDIVRPVWALNGFPDEDRPRLKTEDVAFKDVEQLAAMLRDMAAAGATLAPDDPAINDMRDLGGISRVPDEIIARNVDAANAATEALRAPTVDADGNPLPGQDGQEDDETPAGPDEEGKGGAGEAKPGKKPPAKKPPAKGPPKK